MKLRIKAIIVVFLLIIAMQNAFALGIAPASKVINFRPLLKEEITLNVFNTQNEDIDVFISKQGELSKYITFDSNVVSFNADEGKKSFTYKVSLPEKIEGPGYHDAEILITGVPKAGVKKGVSIGGRVAVVSQLRVRVPYPGKYAEADLYLSVLNSEVDITIPIFNLGTEDIIARANIKIFSGDKELDRIETDSVEVKAEDKNKLTAHWGAPSAGSYRILVEVHYSDKVIKIEREFNVGEMFVRVVDVLFDKVKLGEIARFDIIAQSGWNKPIDVYADVLINDKKGRNIAKLKTASDDIKAMSKGKLTAYWDTKGINAGLYDFIVKLNYAGKISERGIEVSVEEEDIRTTEKVKVVKPSPAKNIVISGVLVIILLSIVIWYLYRKRKFAKY